MFKKVQKSLLFIVQKSLLFIVQKSLLFIVQKCLLFIVQKCLLFIFNFFMTSPQASPLEREQKEKNWFVGTRTKWIGDTSICAKVK